MEECKSAWKSLKTYFKRSGQQLQLKKSLEQECEMRRITKLDMKESVLLQYDDMRSILIGKAEIHRMRNITKDTLELLVMFLKPFKQAAEEMSGSEYPTINLVALWKVKLITN